MKRYFSLFFLFCCMVAVAVAQTFDISQGGVTWRYDANTLTSPMSFSGNTLKIGEVAYDLSAAQAEVSMAAIEQNVVTVQFSAAGSTVVAPGELADRMTITVDGGKVTVTTTDALADEVTYRLSGVGESFRLESDYKCIVELNGVNLSGKSTIPALYLRDGKRIDIVAADGTDNTFQDCALNEAKSAFYVKGHAEWKGAGNVTITGLAKHAYSSNEYTEIKASFTGNLTIAGAVGDGMHIDQYYKQNGGNVSITAQGDGIDVAYALEDDEVTPTSDIDNGQLIIHGGTIAVAAVSDDTKGLKCEDTMTITGGTINAIASGDGSRGLQTSGCLFVGTQGSADASTPYITLKATGDDYTNPADSSDVNKCRGIKVKKDFTFYSGTIARDATSSVKATKMIDVDGIYTGAGGTLKDITIK